MNSTVQKLTELFILEPLLYKKEGIHLAEISKRLKINHTTILRKLKKFEKLGIIKKSKKGNLSVYKINYNHPLIIDYLSIVEKYKVIKFCKNVLTKEIVNYLHTISEELLIFGSFVEDTTRANDVDVITTKKISEKDIKEFKNLFGKELHVTYVKNLTKIDNFLKSEIIKKHIIIGGVEKWIKWMIS